MYHYYMNTINSCSYITVTRLTCIHALIVYVFLLHGSLFLIHKLLLVEYLYIPIALYTCTCYRITDKNHVNLLHVISIVNKLAYLHSGIPVISTVMPASGGTCAELSAT